MENWLLSYRKEWLRPDVIAGLTAAAVVIPKAMAYATIAGLPVQVGLYTAFLPMVIYAVLGTSRALIAIVCCIQCQTVGLHDWGWVVPLSPVLPNVSVSSISCAKSVCPANTSSTPRS